MFKLFKNRTANIPDCWIEYLSKIKVKKNLNIPIDEAEFIILDVEATGLDPKKDKILSIGAVKVQGNQIDVSNALEIYLDQDDFNPEAAPIHGIRKNGNNLKETEKDAMRKLVHYIGDSVIVGHSISFDIQIINETLNKYVSDKLKNRTLDTMSLYKRLKGGDFKQGSTTSLDVLADEFNIAQSDRHTAAGDALITAVLFMKIVSRLKIRGVNSLASILRSKNILL